VVLTGFKPVLRLPPHAVVRGPVPLCRRRYPVSVAETPRCASLSENTHAKQYHTDCCDYFRQHRRSIDVSCADATKLSQRGVLTSLLFCRPREHSERGLVDSVDGGKDSQQSVSGWLSPVTTDHKRKPGRKRSVRFYGHCVELYLVGCAGNRDRPTITVAYRRSWLVSAAPSGKRRRAQLLYPRIEYHCVA